MSALNSKFSKIMVAIDGSEHSLKAAEYALGVAKSFGAQLYAVTVTFVPESHHVKQEDVLAESRENSVSMNRKHGLKSSIRMQKEKTYN
jgi:nucleotide-binding universal stress UspA family protein